MTTIKDLTSGWLHTSFGGLVWPSADAGLLQGPPFPDVIGEPSARSCPAAGTQAHREGGGWVRPG